MPREKPRDMAEEVKKFYGLPPYDGPSNIVRADGYFYISFKNHWGITLEEARRKLGL